MVMLGSKLSRLDKEQSNLYIPYLPTPLARMIRTEFPRNPEAPMKLAVTFNDLVNITDVSDSDV